MDRAKQNHGFVFWALCVAGFLALTGCKKEPDWIELEIRSYGMWSSVASRIGRVEIWLDETGSTSPFSAPSEMVTGTLPGVGVVKAQIRDVEGDGRNELWFEFQTNPFNWDSLVVPIYSDHNYAAGTFNIRVAAFDSETGVLLANGYAITDNNGYAIQFLEHRGVGIGLSCEPLLNCPATNNVSATDLTGGPAVSYVTLSLSLPEAPATSIDPIVRANLGPIEVALDEVDGGKLFEYSTLNGGWARAQTRGPDGTPFERSAMNNDGDPVEEIIYKFFANPFANQTAWSFQLAGTSLASPFTVRARLFAYDGGTLVSDVLVTSDSQGQPIRFGGADASVSVTFTCLSKEACSGDGGAASGDGGL